MPGVISRREKTLRYQITATDSFDRPPTRGPVDCADADTPSLPYQAATMGLLRTGAQNVYQWGVPLRWRSTETLQEGCGYSRTQQNHNHDLKNIFKGAATRAAATAGPFQEFYEARIASGMKPAMARLTLARKIAAITLLVWKKGVCFDANS
jgi:hypothetical protein